MIFIQATSFLLLPSSHPVLSFLLLCFFFSFSSFFLFLSLPPSVSFSSFPFFSSSSYSSPLSSPSPHCSSSSPSFSISLFFPTLLSYTHCPPTFSTFSYISELQRMEKPLGNEGEKCVGNKKEREKKSLTNSAFKKYKC